VRLALEEAKGGISSSLLGGLTSIVFGEDQHGNSVLKRILSLRSPLDEVVNDIIVVISSAIELSQIFTHVVNFYLPQGSTKNAWKPSSKDTPVDTPGHRVSEDIASLVGSGSNETLRTLEGYVLEALRFDPVTPGIVRIATTDRPAVSSLYGAKGDRFYFDFTKAALNPKAFDDPEKINPRRNPESYAAFGGDGVFKTLGQKFVVRATAEVLRAVFSLPKVQRTPGKAGILRRFKEPVVTIDDIVRSVTKPVPYKSVNEKGGLVDTEWTEEVLVYKLQSGVSEKDGKIPAERWAYLEPDNGHRISPWATGLTVDYRI